LQQQESDREAAVLVLRDEMALQAANYTSEREHVEEMLEAQIQELEANSVAASEAHLRNEARWTELRTSLEGEVHASVREGEDAQVRLRSEMRDINAELRRSYEGEIHELETNSWELEAASLAECCALRQELLRGEATWAGHHTNRQQELQSGMAVLENLEVRLRSEMGELHAELCGKDQKLQHLASEAKQDAHRARSDAALLLELQIGQGEALEALERSEAEASFTDEVREKNLVQMRQKLVMLEGELQSVELAGRVRAIAPEAKSAMFCRSMGALELELLAKDQANCSHTAREEVLIRRLGTLESEVQDAEGVKVSQELELAALRRRLATLEYELLDRRGVETMELDRRLAQAKRLRGVRRPTSGRSETSSRRASGWTDETFNLAEICHPQGSRQVGTLKTAGSPSDAVRAALERPAS